MKKLLTILLSVLCLFSIVGINVSAEDKIIEETILQFSSFKPLTPISKDGYESIKTLGVKVDECTFTNKTTGEIENLYLKYGTEYELYVRLVPEEGFSFDAKMRLVIEGNETKEVIDTIKGDPKICEYKYTFKTDADSKAVSLNYSVGEKYVWTITNKMGTDVNAKDIWVGEYSDEEPKGDTLVNVKVTELNINPTSLLTITVDSENAVDDVYKMVTTEGREASYKITGTLADNNKVWQDDNKTVVLSTKKYLDRTTEPVIATGTFNWIDEKGATTKAPMLAGLYQDTLTFTASIEELGKIGGGKIINVDFSSAYKFVSYRKYEGDTVYHFYDNRGEEILTVDNTNCFNYGKDDIANAVYYRVEGSTPVRDAVTIVATKDGTADGDILYYDNIQWGAYKTELVPAENNTSSNYNGKEYTRIVVEDNGEDKNIYKNTDGSDYTIWTVLKNANDNKMNGYNDWYIPGSDQINTSLLKDVEYDYIYSSNWDETYSSRNAVGVCPSYKSSEGRHQAGCWDEPNTHKDIVMLYRSF